MNPFGLVVTVLGVFLVVIAVQGSYRQVLSGLFPQTKTVTT